MSEMIDRVAVAIMDARRRDGDSWAMARAAVEAMREPTEQMIDACDINIPTKGEIIGIWSDMIDAALGKVDA